MSKQLAISILIEGCLLFSTLLLLIQPRLFFNLESEKTRQVLTMSGLFLLCITFCWSVIFGCVLALHQLTFQL